MSKGAPVQTSFIPFADFSYIALVCIKQKSNPLYTAWASNREGIVDYAVLSTNTQSLNRMITDAKASGVSYAGPIPTVGNTQSFTPGSKTPFPVLIQDLAQRGSRGVPFGPEFLVHPNGARGIKVLMVAAANPAGAAQVVGKITGGTPSSRGDSVGVGQATVKFVAPKQGEGICKKYIKKG